VPVPLVLCVVALVSCARSGASVPDGKLSVVASFYPLAAAAQTVGGSQVVVTDLTPPGVEPHDLELAPDDLEAISTADLVVYLGGGFQPAVEDAVHDAQGVALDALDSVDALPPPAGSEASLTLDPHVWLDPIRYGAIVQSVAKDLGDLAPGSRSTFDANADAYAQRLHELDRAYTDGLADCRSRTIVTSHAAFGYLAARYGLTQVAITGLSPEAEPDPARLADLGDLVEREGITTIFTETLVSPKVAETLANETGVSTAVLNPLEGLTSDQIAAGADYRSVMQGNLRTLEEGLGCG
jgi:zinc transport system substrate-binding protein